METGEPFPCIAEEFWNDLLTQVILDKETDKLHVQLPSGAFAEEIVHSCALTFSWNLGCWRKSLESVSQSRLLDQLLSSQLESGCGRAEFVGVRGGLW